MTVDPSVTSLAAAAEMRCFASTFWVERAAKPMRGTSDIVTPPCTRTTRPCFSRASKSLRIVTSETFSCAARSLVRTVPRAKTAARIASRR